VSITSVCTVDHHILCVCVIIYYVFVFIILYRTQVLVQVLLFYLLEMHRYYIVPGVLKYCIICVTRVEQSMATLLKQHHNGLVNRLWGQKLDFSRQAFLESIAIENKEDIFMTNTLRMDPVQAEAPLHLSCIGR
jgi:hypothetical protein